jgi:hypothetical protein
LKICTAAGDSASEIKTFADIVSFLTWVADDPVCGCYTGAAFPTDRLPSVLC